MLERSGILKIANVGDCGVKVIRKGVSSISQQNSTFIILIYSFAALSDDIAVYFDVGQMIFSSSPQEHYFDCPYQLSSEAVGQTYLDATVWIFRLLVLHSNLYDSSKVQQIYKTENFLCILYLNYFKSEPFKLFSSYTG